MASIRTKLTVAYATALTATIVVFSVALYEERGETEGEAVARVAAAEAEIGAILIQHSVVVVVDFGQEAGCAFDPWRRKPRRDRVRIEAREDVNSC